MTIPPPGPSHQREDAPRRLGGRRLPEHQGVRDSRQGHSGMGRTQKGINSRQRHLICDNRGRVLLAMVTAANATDRDAAKELLFRLALSHPEIAIVWADSACTG
ncbi:transposase [Streptomyces umbrinus]|uniref:transposase n=1 Tax=Streptomyces umbrinus TaxID=67370 RepID=UPI003C307162